MKKCIYGLVDCDNFYVSCERIFRPNLVGKPVVVLSNNDGCIIARSNEAKNLGIQMGTPYFKVYEYIKENNVEVFSSNYPLYADISSRIVEILKIFSPNIEMYSIDEAFITLNLTNSNLTTYGKQIRQKILQDIGIPTTVGIAYTKTLTKIASKIGKKDIEYEGCLSLLDIQTNDKYLEMVDVEDIWGIGRQYSKWLRSVNISNAKELKHADRKSIRKKMTVQGLRTVLELNNIECIPLQSNTVVKKNITSSKSFGKKTDSLEDIKKALAVNVSQAGQKLREQNSVAGVINIFITSNPFKTPYYSKLVSIKLPFKVCDTPTLIKYSFLGLKQIFKKGYIYKKCGVILSDISSVNDIQLNLFQKDFLYDFSKKNRIMESVDKLNKKWGRDTVKIASMGIENTLKMKQYMKSQRYTTDWSELLIVNI